MGWKSGESLGKTQTGIIEPVSSKIDPISCNLSSNVLINVYDFVSSDAPKSYNGLLVSWSIYNSLMFYRRLTVYSLYANLSNRI